MNKIDKALSGDLNKRLLDLENALEEFQVNVTEENLKLSFPYVTDRSKQGLGFGIDPENPSVLAVYLNGLQIGRISITQ